MVVERERYCMLHNHTLASSSSAMMKTLRKSRNASTRLQISTPILHPAPPPAGPPSASAPPQKVIRAVASASALSPQHLPFQKGDFFYVSSDPPDAGPYYHACNPVTGARGLVPKNLFEEFLDNSSYVQSSLSNPAHTHPASAPRMSPPRSRGLQRHAFSTPSFSTISSPSGQTSSTPRRAIPSPSSHSPIASGSSQSPSAGLAAPA